MDDLKLIDTKALAKILDLSIRTIRRWHKLKKLPPPAIDNGRPYWTMQQIKDWQKKVN
jgi:DNA-binding transcriptional MerR regulator